jgi:hypothetical protein
MGLLIAVIALLVAAVGWLVTMEPRMLYYPVRARLVELAAGHNDAFLVSRDGYRQALGDFITKVRRH